MTTDRWAYAGTWVPPEMWARTAEYRIGVVANLHGHLADMGAEPLDEVRVLNADARRAWLAQHGDADSALVAAITDAPDDDWLYVVAYGRHS